MSKHDPGFDERIEVLRKTGIPVAAADETRVAESIASSLRSLQHAVEGSLFDTEPQNFERVLKELAKAPRHA